MKRYTEIIEETQKAYGIFSKDAEEKLDHLWWSFFFEY